MMYEWMDGWIQKKREREERLGLFQKKCILLSSSFSDYVNKKK